MIFDLLTIPEITNPIPNTNPTTDAMKKSFILLESLDFYKMKHATTIATLAAKKI